MVALIVFISYPELETVKAEFFWAYYNGKVLNGEVSVFI